jgi:dihydrofolate synthase / folylpolyglutamate synthase
LPGLPTVILDVAHNPHAAQALAENLGQMGRFRRTLAVFGMLRDKDVAGVVREVSPLFDAWFVGGIGHARGATAEEIAQVLRAQNVRGEILPFASPGEALVCASRNATANDRICVFGSFFTVADALKQRQSGAAGAAG